MATISSNTLNFTDLGNPYEGNPETPHSGIMDTPDVPHTPKYLDGGTVATAATNKSAFVELQQHGLVYEITSKYLKHIHFRLIVVF